MTFYNNTAGPIEIDNVALTIWGVPASPIHDALRWKPGPPGHPTEGSFGSSSTAAVAPFFTNPTSCSAQPLQARFHVSSWQEREPGAAPDPPASTMAFGPVVGCDRLGIEPSLSAEVTSDGAYAATGFDLDTSIPQTYENPAGLASSALQKEVVTLPEGMTLNPSAGAGLAACSEAQYAEELAPEPTAQAKNEGRGCPNSSRLATVRIRTPLLEEEVTGSVYLATPAPRGSEAEPERNPFGSLLALYLIARIPNRGVLIKAPGEVSLEPADGADHDVVRGRPRIRAAVRASARERWVAAVAVHGREVRIQPGRERAARDPGDLRRLHGQGGADAVV